jgi:SAM-dependent methyltransferase
MSSLIPIDRIRSVLAYVHDAGSLRHWRFASGECPLCGPSHFVVLRPDPFFTRCVKCKATAVTLSVTKAIQQNVTALQTKIAYEMSTYGSTHSFLKNNCAAFFCSEFFPGRKSGEYVDGILNQDAQALSFADESFHLVTSNQVFEHVPDDLAAYKECYRTLKPAGSLIFAVPLHPTASTEQVGVLRDGSIHWLGTPEFHGSRTTGPNSVPVFWRFSVNDMRNRVSRAGFSTVSLVSVTLVPSQVVPQIIIHAVK